MSKTPVMVAHGDGIGPEIMNAALHVLSEAGAELDIEIIDIGEKVYLAGNTAGIAPEAWESLQRTKVFLKSPITTPQGGGYKSLNVTVRKTLGLIRQRAPVPLLRAVCRNQTPEDGWLSSAKTKKICTPASSIAKSRKFTNA